MYSRIVLGKSVSICVGCGLSAAAGAIADTRIVFPVLNGEAAQA